MNEANTLEDIVGAAATTKQIGMAPMIPPEDAGKPAQDGKVKVTQVAVLDPPPEVKKALEESSADEQQLPARGTDER